MEYGIFYLLRAAPVAARQLRQENTRDRQMGRQCVYVHQRNYLINLCRRITSTRNISRILSSTYYMGIFCMAGKRQAIIRPIRTFHTHRPLCNVY